MKMHNDESLQLSSSKESGWNEWIIPQDPMADGGYSAKENKEQENKDKKKDYYLEWS